jgi:hypothetical protein
MTLTDEESSLRARCVKRLHNVTTDDHDCSVIEHECDKNRNILVDPRSIILANRSISGEG